MVTKERQEKKQEEIRAKILDTAKEIVEKEGIKGLSIRKITNSMEYSPAIIYHYFKDKNEIVETLVAEGFKKILKAVHISEPNEKEPEADIKKSFTNYIKAALEGPEFYKAFMLNEDPNILARIGVLSQGVTEKSPAFKMLSENIRKGIQMGRFIDQDVELTAQIIWTSTFGLLIRLIIEKDISLKQRDRLIEHHFNIVFNGIMNKK